MTISSTDTNTEYSAGDGLDLSGTTFSTDLKSGGGLKISSTELAIDDSIVATVSGTKFSGDVSLARNLYLSGNVSDVTVTGSARFNAGMSGSLTRLTDGTSYLVSGDNVTITSASNGQVTITAAGSAFTAGTGLILDGTEFSINDSVVSTLSGSKFSGDVTLNGNLYVSGNVSDFTSTGSARFNSGLSGSLTRLVDGTSYLAAGSNVTITSASNGQVSIASAIGITELSEDPSPELGGQLVTGDHKIA